MADKFIDQDETQIYGPHAANQIRSRLVGKIPAFDPALQYVADQLDQSTTSVKAAIDIARQTNADRRNAAVSKESILKQSQRLLGRFSKHLAAHEEINRKIFFTRDGTAKGVGSGAQDILLAITHICVKLSDSSTGVRDRAHWYHQFDDAMKALAPAVAFANDALADRQSITPEVEAARQAWLNGYISAKHIVEGVLRQLGRVEHMPIFFYDLRVSAGSRVTVMPPDEPQVAEDADNDDQSGP